MSADNPIYSVMLLRSKYPKGITPPLSAETTILSGYHPYQEITSSAILTQQYLTLLIPIGAM